MSRTDDNSIVESSGNIFADLGLPNPQERHLKAQLARKINDEIEAGGWTQIEAACTRRHRSIRPECDLEPLKWIVEPHLVRRESLGIERRVCRRLTTKPNHVLFVLLVGRVTQYLQQTRVTVYTTTILWWARAFTRNTLRISGPRLAQKYAFQQNVMLPAVSEVVLILGRSARHREVIGHRGSPPFKHSVVVILEGDADLPHLPTPRLLHSEGVQVIVEPTHGVLNGYVQIPERVGKRHLNPAPNGGLHFAERDAELKNYVAVHGFRIAGS